MATQKTPQSGDRVQLSRDGWPILTGTVTVATATASGTLLNVEWDEG